MKATKTERILPPRGYRKHEDHELGRIFVRIDEDKVTYAARIGIDFKEGSLKDVIAAMRQFSDSQAFDAVQITESRCTRTRVKRQDGWSGSWVEAARPDTHLYGALADPNDPEAAASIAVIETAQRELADLTNKLLAKREEIRKAINDLPAFDPAKSEADE